MPEIRAHWNCDHVYVVWRYEAPIAGCRGFALERRGKSGEPHPVHTWVGFDDDVAEVDQRRKSTEWPIQRYMWADFEVRPGQTWSYRAVPMVGSRDDLEPAEDRATGWTDDVTVSPSDKHRMAAYFNRGIVQTQWLAKRLDDPDVSPSEQLKTAIGTVGDPTRNFLGGELRKAMLAMLDGLGDSDRTLYACLFELDDPELIGRLKALGGRARVILANGSPDEDDADKDENTEARDALKHADVQVIDRMVSSGLSHNKFAVICDAAGKNPERVWTGSTNWAETGLCTQANNGLMIESTDVGRIFRDQWDRIAGAGNGFPADLRDANAEPKPATVDGVSVTTWFAPGHRPKRAPHAPDDPKVHADLRAARELIDGATQGILFLMFSPGQEDTLLNYVAYRGTKGQPGYDPNLYIHGVINRAVGGIQLVRRGQVEPANMEILTPAGIDHRFGPWEREIGSAGVNIHSKVIVIDPLGDDPIVMTGSHNLGHAASENNDDNLVIVRGSNALAAAYAVNIIGVYTQYRWRYIHKQAKEKRERRAQRRFGREERPDAGAEPEWSGL